ncbi:unnamed protein product [Nippostrongylus brasiliensis]|uniref:Uncharacterized protein n=1 Tax=Nippostrongylus brasiliensis TaxID=27835 RepID=A0A0N4Y108_NIPBR|nr:unnamed protein product [Nippostrongylus brasiliensis]
MVMVVEYWGRAGRGEEGDFRVDKQPIGRATAQPTAGPSSLITTDLKTSLAEKNVSAGLVGRNQYGGALCERNSGEESRK